MYNYCIRNCVDCYMFRPRILTLCREVFFEGILHRAMKQFININVHFCLFYFTYLFIYLFMYFHLLFLTVYACKLF